MFGGGKLFEVHFKTGSYDDKLQLDGAEPPAALFPY